jgi:hypothetical protein
MSLGTPIICRYDQEYLRSTGTDESNILDIPNTCNVIGHCVKHKTPLNELTNRVIVTQVY